MSSVLGLYGYEKEVFAVIFNFWINADENPVRASLTVIQRIIGGSRPTISRAVNALIEGRFISADKHPGKPTLYTVTISPDLISEFKTAYRPVGSINQQKFTRSTTTGSSGKPQKKRNYHNQNCSTLRVKEQAEISTGGLPEVK